MPGIYLNIHPTSAKDNATFPPPRPAIITAEMKRTDTKAISHPSPEIRSLRYCSLGFITFIFTRDNIRLPYSIAVFQTSRNWMELHHLLSIVSLMPNQPEHLPVTTHCGSWSFWQLQARGTATN